MQVFKLFMQILKKKMPVAMIYVVLFMVLCLAFTAKGDGEMTFEESKVSIVITDNDNTAESNALTEYIGKRCRVVEPKMSKNDALYFNHISFSLTINEGYAQKLAAGDTDDLFTEEYVHENYGAAYMENFLGEYVGCVRAAVIAGDDMSEALKSAEEAMDIDTEVKMVPADSGKMNGLESGGGFFRYLPFILISVMMYTLSAVMVAINKKEVRFRTNCSAISPVSYGGQLVAGSVTFVMAVWVLFMVLGALVRGGFDGKGWVQVLNSGVFAVASALVAVIVSLLINTEQTINIVSNVVGLAMSFMCGVFVPQSMLSDSVLAVGRFMPMYWYTKANDMLTGAELYSADKVAECIGVEAGFCIALAAVALMIFKLKVRADD
ncbi:MAG: ABC transporter permease [Ruminococcus albus]|nr:ABC transporter permease [Ruminococcus albus]